MTNPEQIDAFKAHPLWSFATAVTENLDESTPRSATDRQTIARVKSVLAYVGEHRSVPAYLFTSGRIAVADQLHAFITQIHSQWQGWDQAAAMLPATEQQIDSSCDQILSTMFTNYWPSLQKESRARVIAGAAEAYQSSAEASLQAIEATLAEQNDRLDAARLDLQQLTTAANDRATEAETSIKAIADALGVQAENAAVQLQAELKKVHDAGARQRNDLADTAQLALAKLNRDAETGEKLVQLVGDQSQAGGYLKFANREKWGYRLWTGVGIITIAVSLAYIAYEFDRIGTTAPHLGTVILKSALSLTALAFAGFCFREAGKRQRQSLEARYRAMDLLALGPFSNEMDIEQQSQLRALLGQRLFGSSPEGSNRKADEKVTTFRLDVTDVKTALDAVKVAQDLVK